MIAPPCRTAGRVHSIVSDNQFGCYPFRRSPGEFDAEQRRERQRRLPQTFEVIHENLPGFVGSSPFVHTTKRFVIPDHHHDSGGPQLAFAAKRVCWLGPSRSSQFSQPPAIAALEDKIVRNATDAVATGSSTRREIPTTLPAVDRRWSGVQWLRIDSLAGLVAPAHEMPY